MLCLQPERNPRTQILVEEGVDALLDRIQQEREARLPDYACPQPKYAAYFAWMASRLEERYPALDDASRDKLLCMDSGDLDTLLQPGNEHLDATALLKAADSGIDWETFKTLVPAGPAPLLGQ